MTGMQIPVLPPKWPGLHFPVGVHHLGAPIGPQRWSVSRRHFVEVAIIAEGSLIRIGPAAQDMIPVEQIGCGDAVWDCAKGRMVELTAIACGTFGPRELADQGLHRVTLPGGAVIALQNPKANLAAPHQARGGDTNPGADRRDDVARLYVRLWPEVRTVLQIGPDHVTLRSI